VGAKRTKRAAPLDATELVRVTVGIHKDLLERARNCAYHEPGLTLAELVRRGLEGQVVRFEKGNGGHYPQRRGQLPRGRGLGPA